MLLRGVEASSPTGFAEAFFRKKGKVAAAAMKRTLGLPAVKMNSGVVHTDLGR